MVQVLANVFLSLNYQVAKLDVWRRFLFTDTDLYESLLVSF